MIIIIDNYDSFTFNLVQFIGELGADPRVYRNDAITIDEIRAARPNGLIISPGPGTPDDAGISLEVVRTLGGELPILGVCLGHQVISQTYGATVGRAHEQVHGKKVELSHDGRGLFAGMPNPFDAGRYHSLVAVAETVPEVLEVTVKTSDGLVMGVKHREHEVHGVQFHPESILTQDGKRLLLNFLELSGELS